MANDILREPLIKALALTKPSVANQAFIASLTHFCFDGVSVTSFNDISSISVKTELDLECCLPAELMMKVLGSLTAEAVSIAWTDDNHVQFSAGRSRVKVPALLLSDFPFEFPLDEAEAAFQVSSDFLRGVEKCLVGVGQDPNHPAQMGVTVDPTSSGCTLYATDNFTISRYESKTIAKLPGNTPVILPTFFCQQLLALSRAFPDEPVSVELRQGSVVGRVGQQARIFSKMLVDAVPMDFAHVISRYIEGEDLKELLVEIPDGFDPALERALLVLASETDKTTKVSVKAGRMRMFSSSSHGESNDTLQVALPDAEGFYIDPALVSRGSKICRKMALLPRVMIMSEGEFTHLVAHCAS